MELVTNLQRLVKACGRRDDLRLYVLQPDKTRQARSHNRIFSPPRGVVAPLHQGTPMEHVFTLDFLATPGLRKLAPKLAKARAMALFVSSRDGNEAFSPGNDEARIVSLTTKELAAGHTDEGQTFTVHALDVPRAVFGPPTDDAALAALREAVRALPARALGDPMWLQGVQRDGPLLVQFDERFAPINLGDAGVMYVFEDDAFWQCA